MGDARVFPGGALEPADHGDAARRVVRWSGAAAEFPWRAAALRETAEEAGIVLGEYESDRALGSDVYAEIESAGGHLDADRLGYLSNWVTPEQLPTRFDTRFYVAIVPEGTEAAADRGEVFDPAWITPSQAIERGDNGEWLVEFPTRRHLDLLEGFGSADAVLDHARTLGSVPRIEPRIVTGEDGTLRVVVPGEEEVAG
jgi:8-oxo-dGTP pyrophosphatase MutT (NUDIX family)